MAHATQSRRTEEGGLKTGLSSIHVSSVSRFFFLLFGVSRLFFFLGLSRVCEKKTRKCMVRDLCFFCDATYT